VSLRRRRRGACPAVCMGIKAVESYDGAFQLADASEQQLKALLSSPAFCAQVRPTCFLICQQQRPHFSHRAELTLRTAQVVKQCSLPETAAVAFADVLFQPVPWSPTTRKGMPQEFERYHGSPEFAIINVPPNFMFQAKIFKPSRLCAVYHVTNH